MIDLSEREKAISWVYIRYLYYMLNDYEMVERDIEKHIEALKKFNEDSYRALTLYVLGICRGSRGYYDDMFNMFKKHLAVADIDGAEADYTMIINTTFIEPGYNVGISSKRPEAAMDVSIVAKDNPDKVLAKFEITKAPGGSMFGSGYSFKDRVGGCYENAASRLASYFLKKKIF